MICCSTHSCIHWLILVCALPGDQTCNLGIRWRRAVLGFMLLSVVFLISVRGRLRSTPSLLSIYLIRTQRQEGLAGGESPEGPQSSRLWGQRPPRSLDNTTMTHTLYPRTCAQHTLHLRQAPWWKLGCSVQLCHSPVEGPVTWARKGEMIPQGSFTCLF